MPAEPDHPDIAFAPPLAFVAPLLAMLALEYFVRTSFVSGPVRWAAGGALLVAGGVLNIGGFATQRRAGTDPLPMHPSTTIVANGPYRFTRNPMYVGFALWTAGLATLFDSAWALLAVPIGMIAIDRLIVAKEEAYLERKFGEEYLSYKRRVRRWL